MHGAVREKYLVALAIVFVLQHADNLAHRLFNSDFFINFVVFLLRLYIIVQNVAKFYVVGPGVEYFLPWASHARLHRLVLSTILVDYSQDSASLLIICVHHRVDRDQWPLGPSW